MEDEFNKLKGEAAYGACVLATVSAGVFVGSLAANAPGAVVGAIAGYLYSVAICPTLAKPIKKKLFSQNERLNDQEINALLKVVMASNPELKPKDGLLALANMRSEAMKSADLYQKYLV